MPTILVLRQIMANGMRKRCSCVHEYVHTIMCDALCIVRTYMYRSTLSDSVALCIFQSRSSRYPIPITTVLWERTRNNGVGRGTSCPCTSTLERQLSTLQLSMLSNEQNTSGSIAQKRKFNFSLKVLWRARQQHAGMYITAHGSDTYHLIRYLHT